MKKICITFIFALFIWVNTAQADGLTNSRFLQLSEQQQHFWLAGAFESIGHMVFLHEEEKARCVWNWLPSNPEKKKALLKKSFEKFPEHTPTSVLIALLKRDCGKLLPVK